MDDWWLMMNDDGGWWMTMNDNGWCRWWWMMMHDADCASWSGILGTISPCDQKSQNACMKQISASSYHLFADLHASKTLIIFSKYDTYIYIYLYTYYIYIYQWYDEFCELCGCHENRTPTQIQDVWLTPFCCGHFVGVFVGFPGRCRRSSCGPCS